MPRFYYVPDGQGKLVRDRTDSRISSEGHTVKSHHLKSADLAQAILAKIPEELAELQEAFQNGNPAEELGEYADLLTLIESYARIRNLNPADIERTKNAKIAAKGAFNDGLVIEYVELNPQGEDYDHWLAHFRANSDRYIDASEQDKTN